MSARGISNSHPKRKKSSKAKKHIQKRFSHLISQDQLRLPFGLLSARRPYRNMYGRRGQVKHARISYMHSQFYLTVETLASEDCAGNYNFLFNSKKKRETSNLTHRFLKKKQMERFYISEKK